jgi:hypothetical protein
MSKAFTSDELAGMKAAQEDHMMDACQVGKRSITQSSSGHPVPEYQYGDDVACGYADKGSKIAERSDGSPVFSDASLRLPLGTVIAVADRVKVTARFGVALDTALEFDVAGEPARGPSGLVVPLNRVEA